MPEVVSPLRAALCLCAVVQVANAAPALDPTFGTAGFATIDAGVAGAELGAVLQQSDGKIVVVGNSPALPVGLFPTPVNADFLIARFNANGTPDTSFGNGGVVRIDFEGGEDAARAVVQQPDGRLIVAGWATRSNDLDFAVARLLPDGSLDPSFSGDGKLLVNFAFQPPPSCVPSGNPCLEPVIDVDLAPNRAKAIALQEDGSILLSGESTSFDRKGVSFALLSAAGALDPTFGPAQDGRTTLYLPAAFTSWNFAPPLLRSRSEALVAASSPQSAPLVGKVTLSPAAGTFNAFGASGVLPESLVQQTDGRVLVAGAAFRPVSGAPPRTRTWLGRVDKDLLPDTSFGANGFFTTSDPSDDDGIMGLALERGGKILSAGYSTADRTNPGAGVRATLRRFLVDGAPDASFANGGVLQLDLSAGNANLTSRLQAVMTTAEGRIVVSGTRGLVDPSVSRRFFGASSSSIVIARVDNTPLFELRDDTRQIGEAAASPGVEVSRLGETTTSVSVRYVVKAGTASSGTDFVAASGTLTWNPGDPANRFIPIQLVNDSEVESAETLLVEISEPSEGMIGRQRTTVTIVDDDVAAPPATPPAGPPAAPPAVPSAPSVPASSSGGGGSVDAWLASLLASVVLVSRRRRKRFGHAPCASESAGGSIQSAGPR